MLVRLVYLLMIKLFGCSTARSGTPFAAMGVVRRFAVAGLDEAARGAAPAGPGGRGDR